MSQTKPHHRVPRCLRGIILSLLMGLLPLGAATTGQAAATCTDPAVQVQLEEQLDRSLLGESSAEPIYQKLRQQAAGAIARCRQQTWPLRQGLWLRLYPCDALPGALEALFDRILASGYSEVYLEAFYDGRVLLPATANPTVWPALVQESGYEQRDLLAEAIQRGRERGIKVYAWVFTLNFGYAYSQRGDGSLSRGQPHSADFLARNARGQTSLDLVPESAQVFVDPYHPQPRQDYRTLVTALLQRQPQGILFDYVRYPRASGQASVASRVQDLLIYAEASQQAFLARAEGAEGRHLLQRYLAKGFVTAADIQPFQSRSTSPTSHSSRSTAASHQGAGPVPAVKLTPAVTTSSAAAKLPILPIAWQGFDTDTQPPPATAPLSEWNQRLWLFAVRHAQQGILDFLAEAAAPAQRQGLKVGAVFFPFGNGRVGQQGFDSRLQPWDRLPNAFERHPMAYALCSGHSDCIVQEIQRVLQATPAGVPIIPALAGRWERPMGGDRPPLEDQVTAVKTLAPALAGFSHFAFAWQYPDLERQRQLCRLPTRDSHAPAGNPG
jgi:hypothetical protein